MKGIIVLAFCFLSLGVQAAISRHSVEVVSIITLDGNVYENLSLQESSKVLESLEHGETFEIRDQIIQPEEVTDLVLHGLTEHAFTAKRPNPKDYN